MKRLKLKQNINNNYSDKLSELDLVDLSALIGDLRAGTFGPRRDEYIDAIETVVSIAAKKMPSRKDMEEDNEKYFDMDKLVKDD